MDSLELDIKRALMTSPNLQLQWHEIRDELYEKYKQYDKATFTTTLHRKLMKFLVSGEIEKKEIGHQEVFYYIPKKRQKKINEELERELAHRTFDEIFESFTPQQRKRELQNLLKQRQLPVVLMRNILLELVPFMEEQTKLLSARLENPTDETKAKQSPAEREHSLKELRRMQEEVEKIKKDILWEKQRVVAPEDLKAQLNLIHEFIALVVEPKYSGKFFEAVTDLMRKAVEDEKRRNKR
jgi:ubiquitin-protein ligase